LWSIRIVDGVAWVAVVGEAEGGSGGFTNVESIVTGATELFGCWVVEEAAIGVIIISEKDGRYGLGFESGVRMGIIFFDVGDTEKGYEFSKIRLGGEGFEERGNGLSGCCGIWEVIVGLDRIRQSKEPELGRVGNVLLTNFVMMCIDVHNWSHICHFEIGVPMGRLRLGYEDAIFL